MALTLYKQESNKQATSSGGLTLYKQKTQTKQPQASSSAKPSDYVNIGGQQYPSASIAQTPKTGIQALIAKAPPIIGQTLQLAKSGAKMTTDFIRQVPGYAKDSVQKSSNPKKTDNSFGSIKPEAYAGAGSAVVQFGGSLAGLVQKGIVNNPFTLVGQGTLGQAAKSTGVYKAPEIPERWDVTKQTRALKDLNNQLLEGQNIDDKRAFAVGEFIGSILPYALGTEVATATVGSKILLPTATKFLPGAVKAIPLINDAIGGVAVGQIEHDPENGSRVNRFKNDLIMMGLFGLGHVGAKGLSNATRKLITKTVDEVKGKPKINMEEIEPMIQEVKDAVKKDTGQSIEVITANQLAEGKVPKVNPIYENLNQGDLRTYGKDIVTAGKQFFGEPTTSFGQELVSKVAREYDQIAVLAQASTKVKVRRDARQFEYIISDRTPDQSKIQRLIELRDEMETKGTLEGDIISNAIDKLTQKTTTPQATGKLPKTAPLKQNIQPLAEEARGVQELGFPNPKTIMPIKLNGKTVGGIDATPHLGDSQTLRIHHIRILPEAQGKGLGTQAVNQLFQENPTVNRIIGAATTESKSFWQKMGAKFSGSENNIFTITRPTQATDGVKIEPKVEPIKPIGEGDVKVSKLGLRVEQTAIEKKLNSELSDLPEYKQMNMKEQAKLSSDLLNSDPDRALRVALGEEAAPAGLQAQSVFKALEGSLTTPELARKLAASPLVSEASALGQKIKALDVQISDSPVEAMRQVIESRKKTIEGRYGSADKATAKVTKDIQSKVKTPSKYDWNAFLEEIKC